MNSEHKYLGTNFKANTLFIDHLKHTNPTSNNIPYFNNLLILHTQIHSLITPNNPAE